MQSWGESIALAAKKGGADQQELEWDSYEKFKLEAARQNAEEAKMKELARVRKERVAKVKAALKMARLAQKKREWEENAKVRQESTRKRNKWSKEEKEKLVEFQEEKLKERLMKVKRQFIYLMIWYIIDKRIFLYVYILITSLCLFSF